MATSTTPFKIWYSKNKQKLSEKRKERYKNDPVYREKALERRKEQIKRTPKLKDSRPDVYTFSFTQTAEALEISTWRLRSWRDNDYYPEPYKHGREMWFTQQQVYLLKDVVKFFDKNGPRLTKEAEEELQELVAFVAVNW
jgi:hypothetical protein